MNAFAEWKPEAVVDEREAAVERFERAVREAVPDGREDLLAVLAQASGGVLFFPQGSATLGTVRRRASCIYRAGARLFFDASNSKEEIMGKTMSSGSP